MTALHKSPVTRMTLDEFLSWDPGDPSGARWRLIDGEPAEPETIGPGGTLLPIAPTFDPDPHRHGPEGVCGTSIVRAVGMTLDSIGFTTPLTALYRTTVLGAA
jgi:hypothetical protein